MKKSSFYNLAKIVLFVGVFLFLFRRYSYIMMDKTENAYAATLNDEAKDSVDVVFLGSSQVIYGIQPMQLWEKYGITSYNLATSSTSIPSSYWAAEIAIEKQHPKYLVLDVAFVNSDEKILNYSLPSLHALLDNFPISAKKYEAVNDLVEAEDRLQFYLPAYIYHARWSDGLQEKDFKALEDHGAKGALLRDGICDFENMVVRAPEEVKMDICPTARVYLEQLVDLCREHDVTLVLMAIPTIVSTDIQGMFNSVKDFATEKGIDFIDGYDDPEFWGLDYATDFMDVAHVNLRGSEKVTDFVGDYLAANYNIPSHKDADGYETWDEAYEEYSQFKESVHTYPVYSYGEVLTFGVGGSGLPYFVSGLESIDDGSTHSWSNGKRSDAFFYLDASGDIKLKCNISYVQPAFSTNVRNIGVYFNNNLIGETVLDSTMQDIELEFRIPEELIAKDTFQHLYFRYSEVDDIQYVPRTIALKSMEFVGE